VKNFVYLIWSLKEEHFFEGVLAIVNWKL